MRVISLNSIMELVNVIDCPECGGTGRALYEVVRDRTPWERGGIQDVWMDCETCNGSGEVCELFVEGEEEQFLFSMHEPSVH
jgi:DnaJ-class molecular chaperone